MDKISDEKWRKGLSIAAICKKKRVYTMSLDTNNPSENSVPKKANHPLWDKYLPLITSIASLLLAIISIFLSGYRSFVELDVKTENFTKQLEKIDKRFEEIDDEFDEIDELKHEVANLANRVDAMSNSEGSSAPQDNNSGSDFDIIFLGHIVPSSLNKEVISRSYSEISDYENSNGAITSMRMQNPIAYNRDTQEEYTLEQLKEKKILLHYTSDNKDVYFYGQLDDQGYYTGECTTNVYEDGNLTFVTSANYLHGDMLNFVKVFPTKTKAGGDVWAILDCVVNKNYSNGETWYYTRNIPFHKSFESNNVTEKDIISAHDFLAALKNTGTLEVYYFGNISNGLFNDDTGKAHYVKYFDDGTVWVLYVGKIKDGDFEDTTGNAWMICKQDKDQKNYAYYNGPFVNGENEKITDYWDEELTLSEIDEYLRKHNVTFDCDLRWS